MVTRTHRSALRRAAGAVVAFAVAVSLALAMPVRRVAAGVAGGGSSAENSRERWYRRLWSMLSMQRARALGPAAPSGQQARELPGENMQGHPGHGVTVASVVAIYAQAEAGWPLQQCDLFDDMLEGDCHLRSLFEQREQAVAGKPYVVQAGGAAEQDKLAARVLAAAMSRLPLIRFFLHQLSANRYGWGASEIDWGLFDFEGRLWVVPIWLANVPARRFKIDVRTNTIRLLTVSEPSKGEELVPGKWIVTARPGPLARAALMRTATFPACYKRFGTRDWVIFSHKFGLPLVTAQYDEIGAGDDKGAADDATRQVLTELVRNVGQDGGAVLPKSVDIKVHEAGRAGDASKTQGGLIGYCNAEMSKLINGSTLANDNAGSGGASYALGEVHASVRWDNIQFDAACVEEAFRTQLAAAFVEFNDLNCAPPLLRIQVVRDLTPTVRANVTDTYVNKLGGKASRTQLAEELGYRDPLDGDDVLPGAPAPTTKAGASSSADEATKEAA
jgi:phage gp29-like protein